MVSPVTMRDALEVLPFAKSCPRCDAPWAAICLVNRDLPPRELVTNEGTRDHLAGNVKTAVWDAVEQLKQIATPYVKYACGSTFHEDDHREFDVPEQEVQSAACLKAELVKHRG